VPPLFMAILPSGETEEKGERQQQSGDVVNNQ
jgi:hypothetical protein